jgi:hypothetical protein
MMSPEKTGNKQRTGRFPPGKSGNPGGRPPGTLNKATRLARELLDGEAEVLVRKAIDLALSGNEAMLRLCVERLIPKERPINAAAIPEIERPCDAVSAMSAILQAVAAGEVTPAEAAHLSRLVESSRRAIETEELEQRIADLEKRIPSK